MMIQDFWHRFLVEKRLPQDNTYFDCFHFELTEKWAEELLRLVLCDQKKATASSLYAYEKENLRLPEVGDFSIVTNWAGEPKCVIRTSKVRILPFREMTYDICKLEGEDDTLASWQRGHQRFFTEEGKELGYEFTEDLPVVFEEFEVVYKEA
ncbi:ASCH domain-containing protein [Proteiniclasticum ruminis]|uniref:Uncharacterized protein YhfF n=1 Tax=Proteiniclasticum ruminis TaxID=398199 RepID=A0A1G8KD50_9CLOT|nr:ASCH domain-containing protein [Proteiniclasticum ruminis]SDI41351.1 Uncharacterized protein YhfF [Proteiniclasticum ruminis]